MEFAGGYPGNLHDEINNFSIIAGVVARQQEFDIIHAHDWLTYPADAREAHEGQGQESRRHEGYREAVEALGVVGKLQPVAHARKQHDGDEEAEAAGDAVDDALDEVVVVLHVQQHDAEDGAVGGDERQENAERGEFIL